LTRARKQTIEYFPHRCDQGRVLAILERYWANDGYAVFFKIIERLGKTEGHVLDFRKPDQWEYFLSRALVSEENANAILNKLAEIEVIDKELWKHRIVWDQDFIDDIADLYSRRKIELPTKPDIPHAETPLIGKDVDRNPVEEPVSGADVSINPQSKVKESKVNKRTPLTPLTKIQQERFDTFWAIYPNKKSKGRAERAWQKIDPDEQLVAIIIAKIKQAMKSVEWTKKGPTGESYIPHPATWLNDKGWENVYDQGNTVVTHQKENFLKCPHCGREVNDVVDGRCWFCVKEP